MMACLAPSSRGWRYCRHSRHRSGKLGRRYALMSAITQRVAVLFANNSQLRFPEIGIALRRRGADIITFPSAFTVPTGKAHWEVLLRARAIETQSYIIAAAQVCFCVYVLALHRLTLRRYRPEGTTKSG